MVSKPSVRPSAMQLWEKQIDKLKQKLFLPGDRNLLSEPDKNQTEKKPRKT